MIREIGLKNRILSIPLETLVRKGFFFFSYKGGHYYRYPVDFFVMMGCGITVIPAPPPQRRASPRSSRFSPDADEFNRACWPKEHGIMEARRNLWVLRCVR